MVRFDYKASTELSSLFETFRLMCNDSIRIALAEKPKNKLRLIELAYQRLKGYGLHTHYILSACEVAFSAYRNKNWRASPHFKKPFFKVTSQTYRLNHLILRIPMRPRQFILLILQGSNYHLSFLDDSNLSMGEITITPNAVFIPFSKEISQVRLKGSVGIDMNERNVTISATNGYARRFESLEEVVDIKEKYKELRSKIQRMLRRDNRVMRRLLIKYGTRERNRTTQIIHRVTKEIVEYAKENRFTIKMERLTGIRKRYVKGNGQGTFFRGRMNSWIFGETQRQIDYKGRWDGIPAFRVNPRGTSRNCPKCGSRVAPLRGRKLLCATCNYVWDRDDMASKNIMAAVVPAARPFKGSCEKERDEDSNPSSRWTEVKLSGVQPIT